MDRIARLNALLEQQPEDAFLRHALGLEYLKAGEQGKAEEWFRAALEKDPQHIGTYYHLVELLMKSGRPEEAVRFCELGLPACKAAGDDHAWRELNMLYEELMY